MTAITAQARTLTLRTGRLQVRITQQSVALEELCGFAARNNPKRGFLFVSKVLGKHWPSSPAQMERAHRLLAAQIPPELLAGAVVIGMAETATGLGHGVFEAGLACAAAPALYLQTTRYPISDAQRVDFQEPHSHAAQQFLYLPESADLRALFNHARCVVLVDDEISTGLTLANLVAALRLSNSKLEHIVLLCLTDFSEGAAARRVSLVAGVRSVSTVALLHGAFTFTRDPGFEMPLAAVAFAAMSCRRAYLSHYSARLGLSEAVRIPPALLSACAQLCTGGPVLVLGTGEFMHLAFCLARALCAGGVTAFVQATTRSPILLGNDIEACTEVPDPYGEKIANYLYNVNVASYCAVFVVHETPRNLQLRALCTALGAHAVSLQDERVISAEQLQSCELS